MELDEYLARAKARNGLNSDRELGDRLGISRQGINQYKKHNVFPSNAAMVKLAELAGIDPKIGIIDLQIWRSRNDDADETTIRVLAAIKEKLGAPMIAAVGLIAAILSLSPVDAEAARMGQTLETPGTHGEQADTGSRALYIMGNWLRHFLDGLATPGFKTRAFA